MQHWPCKWRRINFFNTGSGKQQIKFFLAYFKRSAGIVQRNGVTLIVKLGKHITRLYRVTLFHQHLSDTA